MIQTLTADLQPLAPACDCTLNFGWGQAGSVGAHCKRTSRLLRLHADPLSIHLRLGHAGLSSLFAGPTQRIENRDQTRDIDTRRDRAGADWSAFRRVSRYVPIAPLVSAVCLLRRGSPRAQSGFDLALLPLQLRPQ